MAKTKSNPQSENTKPLKTQNEAHNDNAAGDKLHNLKSLNAMLLKETVERRQQVDSLTQVNTSLQSELSRSQSDKDSLQFEFNLVTERAARLEIESKVASRFVEVQVNEIANDMAEMVEKVCGLEREVSRITEEKIAIDRVKNAKESEIGLLNSRLSVLEGEIGEEKFILSRVSEERDAIRAQLEERIQIESGLISNLTEAEKRETVVLDLSRKVKADYDGLVKEKASVEQKMDSILKEKDSIERKLIESNRLVDDLKTDINKISEEKMAIERERDLQEGKKTELQNSVDLLNESVRELEQGKAQLLKEVAELEKKRVASLDKEVKMSAEIDSLVKEKQESIQRLIEEKSLVTKDLDEALKNLKGHNLTIDQLTKETAKISDAKNQAEADVIKFKGQLEELKNTVKTLEKASVVQTGKIKQLESENKRYIASSDQATKERSDARVSLDVEKQKVKQLSEKISNFEKDIEDMQKKLSKMQKDSQKLAAEKKDLENKRAVLENEIFAVKKSLAKTQKEHDVTKGKLKLSEANTGKILKILKNTSSICNSKDDNKGSDQETQFGEEIKHHVTEVEAIKKAFKDKEGIVDEMKKQLELLKVRVAKADKGKSFWTMVSSATTILAAMSLAYVARGGY